MTDLGRSPGVQIDFECRRHLTERGIAKVTEGRVSYPDARAGGG